MISTSLTVYAAAAATRRNLPWTTHTIDDPAPATTAEPPSAQNGWNTTVFKFDAKKIPDIRVIEAPSAGNSWNQLVLQNGKPIAVAHVAERLDIIDLEVQRARTILTGAALVAMLAVVIASIFIAGSALDPIKRLTAAMEDIGSERLERRLARRRLDPGPPREC